jgi:hypothetical protein
MALKTMIENLNKARAAYDKQLAGLGKKAQKGIAEHLLGLIPPGYALKWTQYTPYFNDGEACTFSVKEPYLVRLKDEDGEGMSLDEAIDRYGQEDKEESYETDDYENELPRTTGQPYYQHNYAKKTVTYTVEGFPKIEGFTKAKLKELSRAWSALPEDLLKKAFGDHVEVIVRSNGKFSVDEYSHD